MGTISAKGDMMNEDTVKILLVGVGGYGSTYADPLLDNNGFDVSVEGIVEPRPQGYKRIGEYIGKGIPVYNDMEDFYKEHSADLAVISSPIQFHKNQTMFALRNGSSVLCEKPMCAAVEDGLEMIRGRKQYGKTVSIGYQWSFSDAVLDLKRDILKGDFGKPKKLKTIVLWPRSYSYYARNSWAGRIKDDNGSWVLDSVANNATAHYLHNMFFILGKELDSGAVIDRVQAELYKANDIENFDTGIIRTFTEDDAEILFLASHATNVSKGPEFEYEFEEAVVKYNYVTDGNFTAYMKNGKSRCYGDPFKSDIKKLWDTVDAVKGKGISTCPPEAAFPHTLCINASQRSCPVITAFPGDIVVEGDIINGAKGRYVKDLHDILINCYGSGSMPHELGVPWSVAGSIVRVDRMI
jgi:predicted dehydrogenase